MKWGRAARDTDPRARIDALAQAMDLLGQDATPELSDTIAEALMRADTRVGLDPETTVAALVGATGSGKSSLFNAVVGTDLAYVDVLRPTTTQALAAVHPGHEAGTLLDWIGVDQRVRVPQGVGLPEGVALVDLPDIDSVAQLNRDVAERLAERVDLVVWVLDPQKYADDLIHSTWIAPMARHAQATIVVLTQIDRLAEEVRPLVLGDLRRLLIADGLADPQIIAASSVTGEGIDEVRSHIDRTAQDIRARALRVQAVLDQAVEDIAKSIGLSAQLPSFDPQGLAGAIVRAAGEASGVDRVAEAVGAAYRHRRGKEAGWMALRWLRSFKADPLARLHLGGGGGQSITSQEPVPTTASAALSTGVRRVIDRVGEGRPELWVRQLRAVSRRSMDGLPEAIDTAIAGTDLGMGRPPRWWGWANAVQWLGWIAAGAGALWILGVQLARQFLLLEWPVPLWRGMPVPTCLVAGGLAWTLLVALLAGVCGAVAWRRRRSWAREQVETSVEEIVDERLVAPLVAEDSRQRAVVDALDRAARVSR